MPKTKNGPLQQALQRARDLQNQLAEARRQHHPNHLELAEARDRAAKAETRADRLAVQVANYRAAVLSMSRVLADALDGGKNGGV